MSVEEIIGLARVALGEPVISCADGEILEGMRECQTGVRLLLARQVAYIAEAERRGLAAGSGARNTAVLLQQLLRISGAEAACRVKIARTVTERADLGGMPLPAELPATADALREGVIGLDHAGSSPTGSTRSPASSPHRSWRRPRRSWPIKRG